MIEIPFFINHCCELTRSKWIETGFKLWQETAGPFNGDYRLPEFDVTGSQFRKEMTGLEVCSVCTQQEVTQ